MIVMKELSDWDKYMESEKPIILQVGADWCGPCKVLKPIILEIKGEFGDKVDYVYMDVDKFP